MAKRKYLDETGIGVIKDILDENYTLTVDSALSTTSENPVQNKVVTAELNKKLNSTDIADWAKAENKPEYTYTEVGADPVGSASAAKTEANKYTDEKIADLVGSAPEILNTIEEVATAIQENESVVEALESAIGTKANTNEHNIKTYRTIDSLGLTIPTTVAEIFVATPIGSIVHIGCEGTGAITDLPVNTGSSGYGILEINKEAAGRFSIVYKVSLHGSAALNYMYIGQCGADGSNFSWNRVLTDGDTLDADTLDGKHATDFLNYIGVVDDLMAVNKTCVCAYDGNTLNSPLKAGVTSSGGGLCFVNCENGAEYTNYLVMPSGDVNFYSTTSCNGVIHSNWSRVADGGIAILSREVNTATGKAHLWEDNEGGNLRLISPDGNHAVEMDFYNNSFRMIFRDNDEFVLGAEYNSTTKKFNINGNADTIDGIDTASMILPRGYYSDETTFFDMDDLTSSGTWLVFRDSPNSPPNATAWGTVMVYLGGTGSIVQLWVDFDGVLSFIRSFNGNSWSAWKNVADGGNAATVNGFTVQTAVPANAKFTDTTYGNASATAAGLISTAAQTFAGAKTFNGVVDCNGASAVGTAQARNIYAGTSDMTAGTSTLETGAIYVVYE